MKLANLNEVKDVLSKTKNKIGTIIGMNYLVVENNDNLQEYEISKNLFIELSKSSDFIMEDFNMQTIIKLK